MLCWFLEAHRLTCRSSESISRRLHTRWISAPDTSTHWPCTHLSLFSRRAFLKGGIEPVYSFFLEGSFKGHPMNQNLPSPPGRGPGSRGAPHPPSRPARQNGAKMIVIVLVILKYNSSNRNSNSNSNSTSTSTSNSSNNADWESNSLLGGSA